MRVFDLTRVRTRRNRKRRTTTTGARESVTRRARVRERYSYATYTHTRMHTFVQLTAPSIRSTKGAILNTRDYTGGEFITKAIP